VDLAYLRAHPAQLPVLLHHQRVRETPVSGGDICAAARLTFDNGDSVFAKTWPAGPPPEGFFAAEAAGLRWLADAGTPVPEVIVDLPALLAMEWIEPGRPDPDAAERLGRDLAALHRSGAARFGAPWPGYIGAVPLDNTESDGPWPDWFAERRLAPYLTMSADRGALSRADVARVESLMDRIGEYAGPAGDEAPARIHGDLWPGNVLWSASGRAYLVDPAAHGGHRETDLATLALFGGVPYLSRVLAGYEQVWPLADGWRDRVPLHQLHLLLVHTALFGRSYRDSVMSAARATVER
jgi:fructosamine-3-kinase